MENATDTNALDAAALNAELNQPLQGKQRLTLKVTVNKIVKAEVEKDGEKETVENVVPVLLGKITFDEPPPDGSATKFLDTFKRRLAVISSLNVAFSIFATGQAVTYQDADKKMEDLALSAERAALTNHDGFYKFLVLCGATIGGVMLTADKFDKILKVGDAGDNAELLTATFYKFESLIGPTDAEAKN